MWPPTTLSRLRGEGACYPSEQREQRELRDKQREKERDKSCWRRCFKSFLCEYGDQKKRPCDQDDNRCSDDRIEDRSKKSAHVRSLPQPRTATSGDSRRGTSVHAAARDVNSEG
jgi:hypothetical protein